MTRFGIVIIALLTGCTVETTRTPHLIQPVPGAAPNRVNVVAFSELQDTLETPDPTICDVLPADGVCAYACDPEGIDQFIPKGACAFITCNLTDGRVINIGGCN